MSGIQMMLFGGTGAPTVNFGNVDITAAGVPSQSAGYRVDTDGSDYQVINAVDTSLIQWVNPPSAGGDYEVFATVVSGTVSSGTVGSWVATSTSPFWTRVAAIAGTITIVELSMEVRKVGTATILDTWSVRLEAERF